MSTTTQTMTPVICSECGVGHFRPTRVFDANLSCDVCAKRINVAMDVRCYLDDDETLTIDGAGVMCVILRDDLSD